MAAEFDGRAYQARFDELSASGADVHGEAHLVRSFRPTSVLDAGCGTGRVAAELSRHDIDTVGVDVDESMLAEARRVAPQGTWVRADLATLSLGRTFDVVVLAGNVPIFCPVADRGGLVAACAGHVRDGGRMVAGFELERGYQLSEYDAACTAAGLVLVDRWSTWGCEVFESDSRYAVSVHRR